MNRQTNENARSRILTSAANIFAKKSFDGARVDEIAKDAGVPKSLIYYHFKSKDEILKVLIDEFLNSYAVLVDTYRDESNRKTANDLAARMQTVYYQFGIEHEALVRTILMDSVKKGNTNTALYQMVSELIQSKEELTSEQKEHLINEFFFNIMPCIAYICMKDSWISYFNMEESQFDKTFLTAYSNNHIQYHNGGAYHEPNHQNN